MVRRSASMSPRPSAAQSRAGAYSLACLLNRKMSKLPRRLAVKGSSSLETIRPRVSLRSPGVTPGETLSIWEGGGEHSQGRANTATPLWKAQAGPGVIPAAAQRRAGVQRPDWSSAKQLFLRLTGSRSWLRQTGMTTEGTRVTSPLFSLRSATPLLFPRHKC